MAIHSFLYFVSMIFNSHPGQVLLYQLFALEASPEVAGRRAS